MHSARCHGAKPRRTAWHVSNKGDMYDKDWAFLRDADFDGSTGDKSKGIGPSFVRADLSSVEQAKTRLSDHYIQGIEYTLKPDAKRFRFFIWGNHGRPTTFGDMFKAFNASRRSFEFPSASG